MAEVTANGLRFHVQVLQSPPIPREPGAGRPNPSDPDPGPASSGEVDPSEARPKAVMIHGLSVDMSCFYVTIAGGVAVDSDVYLYDLRGHGRSEVPMSNYSVADHLADLAALLEVWGIDEPVHLVGNSFGGILALFFAHLHPERVASLFLVEPHLSGQGWGQRLVEGILEFGEDEAERGRLIGKSRANLRWAQRAEVMLRTTTVLDDLSTEADLPDEWLASLRCPVFSIYGSNSDVVEEATARDRLIPGCEPVILPGCTHLVLAEASATVRDHAIAWIRLQSKDLTAARG